MMLATPDRLQERMFAALVQALLLQTTVTQDIGRFAVTVATDYSQYRLSNVMRMLGSRLPLRKVGVCQSRRPKSKCGKLWGYTLNCHRSIAEAYLDDLKLELGPEYPVVTDAMLEAAEPKVIARGARKSKSHKPDRRQRQLFAD